MSDKFDWNDDGNGVVFPSVQAVAIYKNPAGNVVIRQERDPLENADTWIVIPFGSLKVTIDRLADFARWA